MEYSLMFVESSRDNFEFLYKFDTTEIDGKLEIRKFKTEEELDSYVEYLLNNKGCSKSDFIIVQVKEYNVKVDIYEN